MLCAMALGVPLTKMARFESLVDPDFLRQTQDGVAELACEVVNTVTHMGWQFPGGGGPGDRIA